MKPIDTWSMEAIFMLTGVGVLVLGTALGLLGAWLQSKAEEKEGRKRE